METESLKSPTVAGNIYTYLKLSLFMKLKPTTHHANKHLKKRAFNSLLCKVYCVSN